MNIALLGTDLMGQALIKHLLAEQQQIIAYNHTPDKLKKLVNLDVNVSDSAQSAIEQGDSIILMLSDAQAIN